MRVDVVTIRVQEVSLGVKLTIEITDPDRGATTHEEIVPTNAGEASEMTFHRCAGAVRSSIGALTDGRNQEAVWAVAKTMQRVLQAPVGS